MALQPDASADLIDEKGHTREEAAAQVPNLDLDAPAASQEQPGTPGEPSGNVMVPAQTPEEVAAQVRNIPGHPDESHDIDEQLDEAAERGADSAEEDTTDETEDADEADILRGKALDEKGAELGIEGFSSMSADEKREAVAAAEAEDEDGA